MDDIPREMVELVTRNCDEPRWVRARLLTEADYDWKRDRATVIQLEHGAPARYGVELEAAKADAPGAVEIHGFAGGEPWEWARQLWESLPV